MDLVQCSAVVSGGTGGLGGATSRHLAELGMEVVIFESDGDRAEMLAKEIGGRAVVVAGDQINDADRV